MGITLMLMILGTVTPFIFLYLKKKPLAILQSVLLVGMWFYFIQVMFMTVPGAFSLTWLMFYASLLVSAAGWVLFIIAMVNSSETYQKEIQSY